jgi:hypothetical protein
VKVFHGFVSEKTMNKLTSGCIVLFLVLIVVSAKAQPYNVMYDDMGRSFPAINGKLIKDSGGCKNSFGKYAWCAAGKALTKYSWDYILWDEWKPLVVTFNGIVTERHGSYVGKYGLIDKTGKIIQENEFDLLWDSDKRNIIVFKGKATYWKAEKGLWGYLDQEGKVQIPVSLEYNRVDFFCGDYAKVFNGVFDSINQKDIGKYGFIDTLGNEVVSCILSTAKYDYVGRISEGLITVGVNSESNEGFQEMKFGLVDFSGKIIIPTIYDGITGFKNGICHVSSRELCGCSGMYINRKGKRIYPTRDELDKYYELLGY